ncbi:hypothetical protein HDV02_005943, partial [Globomyces sp. JEL0801]
MSDQVKSLLKAYQIEGRDVQVKRSQPMDYNTLGFLCDALKRSNMQDTEKLKYQSLFTLAWYCWLRIDEVLLLKFRDLQAIDKPNLLGPAGETSLKFSVLRIPFRKTDQTGIGALYELHDDVMEPNVMVNTNLRNWLNRRLNIASDLNVTHTDDTFLFPKTDGYYCTWDEMTTSQEVQIVLKALINQLVNENRVVLSTNADFTLHCFRRGGCQHRFFYSRRAWSLAAIKAWGGWSKSERTDILINYVMNEYEVRDRNLSVLDQSVTQPDWESMFNELNRSLDRRFRTLEDLLRQQHTIRIPLTPETVTANLNEAVVAVAIPRFTTFEQLWKSWVEGGTGYKPLRDWTRDDILETRIL